MFGGDVFLKYFLVLLGSLPIIATMAACFVFMFREPNRLQSEEFVLRQHELSLIEHKGHVPSAIPSEANDSEDLLPEPAQINVGPER